MLQRAIITAASVIALTATANAADLGSYKGGPASYASVNWSGLYGGVNAGYGDGTAKTTVENSYGTSTNGGYGDQSKSFDSTGGIGGGQIGYNVQNGRVVFGVEADLDASRHFGNSHKHPGFGYAPLSTAKGKGELNYGGTLRGRVGYTFDNALVYATGGLAFGDATDSLTMRVAPPKASRRAAPSPAMSWAQALSMPSAQLGL